MFFCYKCGTRIDGDASFCSKCGASFGNADSTQEISTVSSGGEKSTYHDEFDYYSYHKKEKQKDIIIGLIAAAILVCEICAWFFLFRVCLQKSLNELVTIEEDNNSSNNNPGGNVPRKRKSSSENNTNNTQKSSEYLNWKTYCGEYIETAYYDYEEGFEGEWLQFGLYLSADDDNCGYVDIIFRGMHCYYELAYIDEGMFELTYNADKSDYSGDAKLMEITFTSSPYNDDYYDALVFYDSNGNLINTFISDENYWVEYSLGPIESMIVLASTRELTTEDLQGYSSFELSAIRNGIYAQYGYVFNNTGWNEYFSQYSWYEPDLSFTTSMVSYIEEINAGFIRKYEEEHFGGVYTP